MRLRLRFGERLKLSFTISLFDRFFLHDTEVDFGIFLHDQNPASRGKLTHGSRVHLDPAKFFRTAPNYDGQDQRRQRLLLRLFFSSSLVITTNWNGNSNWLRMVGVVPCLLLAEISSTLNDPSDF